MRLTFPWGAAPLSLLAVAVLAGAALLATAAATPPRADLVFALFSKEHKQAYEPLVAAFAAKHGVRIEIQHADMRALQSRLQSGFLAGAEVPDLVELAEPAMGYFTKGPLSDLGFVDLTERIRGEGIDKIIPEGRFAMWSTRGRIFALPHDVHPTALVYRKDLVAELGIDVAQLATWQDVLRIGRTVTVDRNGDGVIDRYLLDLPAEGDFGLRTLLLQRGGGVFDAQGQPCFDDEKAVEVCVWYAQASRGPGRIAFPAGWGQQLSKAMSDGIALFYIAPDWRTRQFEMDMPHLSGKLGLLPLPVWEPGGRRTSTWGGTGICITKACRNPELAWKLINTLYLQTEGMGERFASSNILPPFKASWELPEVREPRPFWSGVAVGSFYAALAPDVPANWVTPYTELAYGKLNEAFNAIAVAHEAGEKDLAAVARRELKRCADYVRTTMARNRFMEEAP
jgi:arabinosaccharide transport system substrate-binding protein